MLLLLLGDYKSPGFNWSNIFDGGLQIRRDAIISRKDLPKRPERAEAPSPGQHPGLDNNQQSRPVRAKALYIARYFKAFALTGRLVCAIRLPRALPWARSFCPFRACCQKLASVLSLRCQKLASALSGRAAKNLLLPFLLYLPLEK